MSTRFKPPLSLSGRFRHWLPLIATLLMAGGCGVSKQTVEVRSEPPEAFVYVNGKFVGNSPLDLRLNRQVPHRVEFRKPGFLSDQITLYPSYEEGDKPGVVFGPFQEAGLYRVLEPNPVSVILLYEGLEDAGEVLSKEEAGRLLDRIQSEVEEGEMTEAEASAAEAQVLGRVAD